VTFAVKNIRILLIFLLIMPVVFAYVCQDDTPINKIPCEIISPVYVNCSDYYNYSVIDLNTTLNVQNGTMSPKGDGTYNFTFLQNITFHSYQIKICDNLTAISPEATGIINVIIETNAWWDVGILALIITIVGIYIVLSLNINQDSIGIRTLFLIAGLIISITIVPFIKLINEMFGTTAIINSYLDVTYKVTIVTFIFTLVYIFLTMFIRIFMAWMPKKEGILD